MTDWWLDELTHAGPEHLDADYVARYERKAGYDPSDDLAALSRYGFGVDSTVIDLGAGTGVFALAAAQVCRHVVAVDVSTAMLEVIRSKVQRQGAENVTVVQAGLLSYEHNGEPAGFVFTRNTLHQLPDFWKGLALMRIRHMFGPSGVLRLRDLAYDFEPGDSFEMIRAWLGGAVSDSTVGFTATELARHVRDEFSTYSWILEGLVEHSGFRIAERDYRRHIYCTYTCLTSTD